MLGRHTVMKLALILIDMQKYFLNLNPILFREKLIPNIQTALSTARSSNISIIHVITRYHQDKSDWPAPYKHSDTIWCIEGTEDAEILEAVKPLDGERVVVKTRFSGFYKTDLEDIFVEDGIEGLVIAGYASDACVRMTVVDAYYRDFIIFLLKDCVHAFREDTEGSIQYLQWLTKLTVISMEEMNRMFQNTSSQ
jgi:biuret amidohydrolase